LAFALLVVETGAAEIKNFNAYIMRAYGSVKHRSANYDANSWFSKDLDYGDQAGIIKAKRPPGSSMCNAAVTEVIIEAINLYSAAHSKSNWSPQKLIPANSWNQSDWTQLRPHLFGHDYTDYEPLEAISKRAIPSGLKSDIVHFHSEHGMALAIERFGLGTQIDFKEALPGDIITFDRDWGDASAPGHSVIFLAFINDWQEEVPKYGQGNIVGFKYFSIQESKPAGFGERWAYFKVPSDGKQSTKICPRLGTASIQTKPSRCEDANVTEAGRSFPLLKNQQQTRDCCIIEKGDNGPRVGRMFSPPYWTYKSKQKETVAQERELRKHVEEFLENIWRAGEQLQLFGKGALAFERENPSAATAYLEKVKNKFGIDLRAVAQDSAVPQIDKKILASVFKSTPRRIIRLANEQVDTKKRAEIEQRARAAAAQADLLGPRTHDGVSNRRFTGETD
jgi:hypothetical protein